MIQGKGSNYATIKNFSFNPIYMFRYHSIFLYFILFNTVQGQIILTETMGTVSSNTAIATHQNNGGFAQGQWSYTGNADVRATSPSPGGGANVFITNAPNQSFRLDGLSGTGCSSLTLQCRIWKSGGATNSLTISEFFVQVSSDGSNWTDLDWGGHTLGQVWIQTGAITIPTNTIAIRFIQPVVPDQQVRIDDITLTGTGPCENSLLPVTFSSLRAININKKVLLQFITESEVNNHYFTMERSDNGADFKEIGRLAGAGNSDWKLFYEYVDEIPLRGVNYYRIKQTDYDGFYDYSPVVTILMQSPVKSVVIQQKNDQIVISTDEVISRIEIFSLNGQKKHEVLQNGNYFEISTENLSPGLYLIKVSGDSHQIVQRFFKI
jgi:hypothetical protein